MEKYKKLAYIGISAVVISLLLYVLVKYAVEILLPFLIALVVTALARPLTKKLQKRTKIPKGVVSIFVISFLFVAILVVIALVLWIAFNELGEIIKDLGKTLSQEENFLDSIIGFLEGLDKKFPFLSSFADESQTLSTLVTNMLSEAVKGLGATLTSTITRIISALPGIGITIIVTVLSLFYFAKDYEKIGKRIVGALPKKWRDVAIILKNEALVIIQKYIKSYLILTLITFSELFLGFIILRIKNAFVLSLIISLLDMLPILGASAILLPWAIVTLINKNITLGVGLIVLSIIIYIVRQYAEPRLISKQMNIHPLLTLFSMYAGLKIAGFIGVIVGPIIAFVIKTIYKAIKSEKNIENEEKL